MLHLCLPWVTYIPVWLQPADALTGHTAPSVSCAVLRRDPTPAASRGETPAGPEPVWPCPRLGRITAPHLQKVDILLCYQHWKRFSNIIRMVILYITIFPSIHTTAAATAGWLPIFTLYKLFMEGTSRGMSWEMTVAKVWPTRSQIRDWAPEGILARAEFPLTTGTGSPPWINTQGLNVFIFPNSPDAWTSVTYCSSSCPWWMTSKVRLFMVRALSAWCCSLCSASVRSSVSKSLICCDSSSFHDSRSEMIWEGQRGLRQEEGLTCT